MHLAKRGYGQIESSKLWTATFGAVSVHKVDAKYDDAYVRYFNLLQGGTRMNAKVELTEEEVRILYQYLEDGLNQRQRREEKWRKVYARYRRQKKRVPYLIKRACEIFNYNTTEESELLFKFRILYLEIPWKHPITQQGNGEFHYATNDMPVNANNEQSGGN